MFVFRLNWNKFSKLNLGFKSMVSIQHKLTITQSSYVFKYLTACFHHDNKSIVLKEHQNTDNLLRRLNLLLMLSFIKLRLMRENIEN